MKKLFALISCCLITSILFAQTPAAIEADLIKSFGKIDYYWNNKTALDTTSAGADSLETANDRFGKKLQEVATKFPFTITQKFDKLRKQNLVILSSNDGLFRIYSWDRLTGGSMHNFENVLQYRSGAKTYAILDTASAESGTYVFTYYKLHTLIVNKQHYYLAIYYGVFTGTNYGQGIRIFSVENGNLVDAKLIKTQSGLHNKLYYRYDGFSASSKANDSIAFDEASKTITLPVVQDSGKVTNNRILYKFTGQYFERTKN